MCGGEEQTRAHAHTNTSIFSCVVEVDVVEYLSVRASVQCVLRVCVGIIGVSCSLRSAGAHHLEYIYNVRIIHLVISFFPLHSYHIDGQCRHQIRVAFLSLRRFVHTAQRSQSGLIAGIKYEHISHALCFAYALK